MKYLDVRTIEEYESGHIDDAMHFDVALLMSGNLPNLNRDEEIVLYCQSGGRAEMAKMILESNGFTKVKNAGGIEDLYI